MTVRAKLAVAVALPIGLLGGMLVHHVLTTRRAVATSHELIEVWSLVHRTSIEQRGRVTQLEEHAAKFLITRDSGYLGRLRELAGSFEEEVRGLQALPLDGRAGEALARLGEDWERFAPLPERLAASVRGGAPGAATLDRELGEAITRLRHRTDQVSQAAHEAMAARLAASRRAAQDAERAALAITLGALGASLLVVGVLMRSIARPIRRLADGVSEIARGRLHHRLDDGQDGEFAFVTRQFNRMAARLDEVDRLKRDFVASVSHDLKTPLASIEEATELLLDEVPGPLTAPQRTLLRLHRESTTRLRRMMGQLLDLSHLDSSPAPAIATLSLSALARDAATAADSDRALGAPRIQVCVAEEVRVDGDAERLRRLLDNLLDNALKYSMPGAPIAVGLERRTTRPAEVPPDRWAGVPRSGPSEALAWLTVADSGPGIPDAEKENVFSRFHRGGHRARGRGRGVGLGLAICREIAQSHGGAIWVADGAAGGSVVHLLLPRARAAAAIELGAPAAVREVA